jgi:hypothetical protein
LAAMPETSDVRMNCSEKCQYARFCCEDASLSLLGVFLPYTCAFLLSCVQLLYTDAWIVVLPAMQKTITCSFLSFYLPWFLSLLVLKSLILPALILFNHLGKGLSFSSCSFALCLQSSFGFELKIRLWVKISFRFLMGQWYCQNKVSDRQSDGDD